MMNLVPFRKTFGSFFPRREYEMIPTEGFLKNVLDSFFNESTDASYMNEKGDVTCEIEVPGFNKDNLRVSIENGIMTISGERETKNECHAGSTKILRRMSVGTAENVNAEIVDGILYITFLAVHKDVKNVEVR